MKSSIQSTNPKSRITQSVSVNAMTVAKPLLSLDSSVFTQSGLVHKAAIDYDHKELTRQDFGDTNGLFYYVGTDHGLGEWVNPISSGKIFSHSSSDAANLGHPSTLFDRIDNTFHTDNTPNLLNSTSWILVVLPENSHLLLKEITIKSRPDANQTHPNPFRVYGLANDGAGFTTLYDSNPAITAVNQWKSLTPSVISSPYRVFLIAGSSSSYFALNEIELYGTYTFPKKNLVTITRPELDNDVKTYLSNVQMNGGRISDATLRSVNTFTVRLKESGVWAKIRDMGIYCGDNLAAALVKLKYPNGVSPVLENLNFEDSDYIERGASGGLKGNGLNKILRTGIIPSQHLVQGSTSYSVYTKETSPQNPYISFGVTDVGANNRVFMHYPLTDGTWYADCYNAVAGRLTVSLGAKADGYGHLLVNRTALSLCKLVRKGEVIQTKSSATGGDLSLIHIQAMVFGANVGGTLEGHSNGRECFYHFGIGMSDDEATKFYQALQALQMELGRNTA